MGASVVGTWLRRRIGLGASSVLLVSLLAAVAPSAALLAPDDGPARLTDVDVLQYNVHKGRDGDIVGQLTAQVQNDRPDVVTLNELCRYDYEELVANLEQLGYAANFTVSHRNSLGCRAFVKGWDQGVAVFVAGGAVDGSAGNYRIGQGVACLTSDSLPRVRACAVHLTSPHDASPPGDASVRRQVDALHEKVSQFDLPLVVAGDFNLPPWDPSMQRVYGDFYDVGMNDGACAPWPTATVSQDARLYGGHCTFDHSRQGGKKIDYAFVDKRHFSSVAEAAVEPLHGPGCHGDYLGYGDACSDHRQLRGSASIQVSDLALQPEGYRMWTAGTPVDDVRFGQPRPSGEIVGGLGLILGPVARTIDAATIDGACPDEVDRYALWGRGGTPTFALALRQAKAGSDVVVVGYRLYDSVEGVAVRAGAAGLSGGWSGQQCGLDAVQDVALAAASGYAQQQALYLQPDVPSGTWS